MEKFLLRISFAAFFLCGLTALYAQSNQVVLNGGATNPIQATPVDSRLYVSAEASSVSGVNMATSRNINAKCIGDDSFATMPSDGNAVKEIKLSRTAEGLINGPIKFNTTANPYAVTPVITASNASGGITACVGTASASPSIQQFTVSGIDLIAAITANAPAGFELSLSMLSGFNSTISLNQSAGSLINTIIYVRSAATAGPGPISGNVLLSSTGAVSQQVAVSAVINALLTVNQVNNQAVANGAPTATINFTGTGSAFTWVNDTPGIGLAANGTGNIASFTAINMGSSPVTATITAMPVPNTGYAYITCTGSNSVSVVNIATNTVIATIPAGTAPFSVAVNHAGTIAYIGNAGSISVINTATNVVTATILVANGSFSMILSPDDSKLYVTNDPYITVIDTGDNSVIGNFTLGGIPIGLAISPDGKTLYVSGNLSQDIEVFNTVTYNQIANIQTGHSSGGLALNPDGSLLYSPSSFNDDVVVVINTIDNSVVSTITVGAEPFAVVVSNDGSRAYVSNIESNTVSVINTASNQVVATVSAGESPGGMSFTADGSSLYVVDGTDSVTVVNTSTNIVTAKIAVGSEPVSFGNFIISGPSCGNAASFTITVAPPVVTPVITAGDVTGNISACAGTASVSPALQQFTVSGSGLTTAITATAPTGFELSLTSESGFGSSITLNESSGTLSSTTVYVRSAAAVGTGPVIGNVLLSSTGAASQSVPVAGIVNALPITDPVINQSVENGMMTKAIDFSGTATSYAWTNDTPGIGLAAGGTGNIPSFTAIDNTNTAITATLTVTPQNSSGCSGLPVEFSIVVNPTPPPSLNTESNLAALTTIYGTPSTAESFTVSGASLTSGISVGPLTGFELSSDGTTFSASYTIGNTGSVSSAIVYIRLAASAQVGEYGGIIPISSTGAPGVTVVIPVSTVTPAPLTIIANDETRLFGSANPPLTVTYIGFVNNDGPAQLTTLPLITTTATTSSAVGGYPITAGGAASPDYNFTYLAGLLTVSPSLTGIVIPNAFTPNGDGINDTWVIPNLEYYPKSTVNIFNRWGQKLYSSIGYAVPWDGTYRGSMLPTGTYYYIIDPKNGLSLFSGWVAIIR